MTVYIARMKVGEFFRFVFTCKRIFKLKINDFILRFGTCLGIVSKSFFFCLVLLEDIVK